MCLKQNEGELKNLSGFINPCVDSNKLTSGAVSSDKRLRFFAPRGVDEYNLVVGFTPTGVDDITKWRDIIPNRLHSTV